MAFVTALFVLTTTAAGETLLQTVVETKFVVDCKVNPAALVGHVKMTFVPEGNMVSVGAGALTDPNVRLNTVPLPELPPPIAVPNRVLPDKTKLPFGAPPSLLLSGKAAEAAEKL